MNDPLFIFLIAILGGIGSYLITPEIGKYMKKRGKVGKDVHKVELPEIPESGGIGFMLVYICILLIGIIFAPTKLIQYRFVLFLVILSLVTLVGLYDDFKKLSALAKPGILMLVALPVVIFRNVEGYQLANPRPVLPIVGATKLGIVYWGLAIFVIAIPSNASNMLDVMNGVMAGSGILVALTAFSVSYILPLTYDQAFLCRYTSLTLAFVLLGFYLHNRYPAKIFGGDTGSLGVGAAIGLIAVYSQIEFVLVVALLVHIMNSFSILGSLRGLKERHDIKARPVRVENGIIIPSKDEKAPITLVRLIVSKGPLPEKMIIRQILILVFYSCLLAILTAFLIKGEIEI